MVDDQLHRHHRVDLGRVTATVGDGVAQAGEVDQRGLAKDVVAHHAGREPGEVEVALALDQLAQRGIEAGRIAAAHQVFRQYAGGIRKTVIGAGLDRIDRRAGVEIIQASARQVLAKFTIHGTGTQSR
ncbi:hypothetical protein D3C81_1617730 [compost metagenome]